MSGIGTGGSAYSAGNAAIQDRHSQERRISYSDMIWVHAQATRSSILPYAKMIDVPGDTHFLSRRESNQFVRKIEGVQDTIFQKTPRSRRALRTQQFTYASITDPSDLDKASANVSAEHEVDAMYSIARVSDSVALAAVIGDVLTELPAEIDDASTQALKTPLNVVNHKRDVCWILNDSTAVDASSTDLFDPNSIETLMFRLHQMDVDGPIYVSLTPVLAHILRTDTVYQNRENIYSVNAALVAQMGLRTVTVYKGVSFVSTSPVVLPGAELNAISATALTANKLKLVCRRINLSDSKEKLRSRSYASSKVGHAQNFVTERIARINELNGTDVTLTNADFQEVEVQPSDLAYFWVGKAICIGRREGGSFRMASQLIQKQGADAWLYREELGAVCIDDDYVGCFPVRGKRLTTFTS